MSKNNKIIDNINSSMSMENMPLSKKDKELLKECLEGNMSYEDVINDIINKYTHKQEDK